MTSDAPAPVRSTQTQNQLDALDDDGNPHRPDEPDEFDEFAPGALVPRALAAIAASMRAHPYAWIGIGLGGFAAAMLLRARRR